MAELSEWADFYVIVGSATGALIGLQFVVMTLIANRADYVPPEAGAAFTTPSVVHFAVALLLSAVASAPWHGRKALTICWGVIGFSGLIYTIIVARRMRVQKVYRPVCEDWLFHALLPFAAYALLVGAAVATRFILRSALFAVGLSALLLLFIGIHNAWDTVTYHVFEKRQKRPEE